MQFDLCPALYVAGLLSQTGDGLAIPFSRSTAARPSPCCRGLRPTTTATAYVTRLSRHGVMGLTET